MSLGSGPASEKPCPARSYEQARVILEIAGCTFAQAVLGPPNPYSKITVGVPLPVQ